MLKEIIDLKSKMQYREQPEQDGGNDHEDDRKFPSMDDRNFTIGGVIVVLGLILGLLILSYQVFHTEAKRMDAAPRSEMLSPEKPVNSTPTTLP